MDLKALMVFIYVVLCLWYCTHNTESKSAENTAEATSVSVPVVKNIKFKEEEVVDKNGEKKIVRIILELTVNGSSYSYRKIQKTVKTKHK